MVVQTGGSACGLTSDYCTYRCVQQVGRSEGGGVGGREGAVDVGRRALKGTEGQMYMCTYRVYECLEVRTDVHR